MVGSAPVLHIQPVHGAMQLRAHPDLPQAQRHIQERGDDQPLRELLQGASLPEVETTEHVRNPPRLDPLERRRGAVVRSEPVGQRGGERDQAQDDHRQVEGVQPQLAPAVRVEEDARRQHHAWHEGALEVKHGDRDGSRLELGEKQPPAKQRDEDADPDQEQDDRAGGLAQDGR